MPTLYQELINKEVMKSVTNNKPFINDNKEQTNAIRRRFRDNLVKEVFHERCPVTGIKFGLIASHIKPLAVCLSEDECIDPANGLLLSKNLDALFDKGHISFNDDGKMITASSVSNLDYQLMIPEDWLSGETAIPEMRNTYDQDRRISYMRYHRYNVYKPYRDGFGKYISHAEYYDRYTTSANPNKDGHGITIPKELQGYRKYREFVKAQRSDRAMVTGVVYSTEDYVS
mgnify:CR=1 FL=1